MARIQLQKLVAMASLDTDNARNVADLLTRADGILCDARALVVRLGNYRFSPEDGGDICDLSEELLKMFDDLEARGVPR